MSQFDVEFIQKKLESKYTGEYWQSPHKFSAAKFQGKPLHQWAREGVEIKKEQVRREVYELEVVKYEFPELWIRYKVSSGTYIRTLFRDCAIELGTIGMLDGLTREEVGGSNLKNAVSFEPDAEAERMEIDHVLPFGSVFLNDKRSKLFANGVKLREDQIERVEEGELKSAFWVRGSGRILGLASIEEGLLITKVNFPI